MSKVFLSFLNSYPTLEDRGAIPNRPFARVKTYQSSSKKENNVSFILFFYLYLIKNLKISMRESNYFNIAQKKEAISKEFLHRDQNVFLYFM